MFGQFTLIIYLSATILFEWPFQGTNCIQCSNMVLYHCHSSTFTEYLDYAFDTLDEAKEVHSKFGITENFLSFDRTEFFFINFDVHHCSGEELEYKLATIEV